MPTTILHLSRSRVALIVTGALGLLLLLGLAGGSRAGAVPAQIRRTTTTVSDPETTDAPTTTQRRRSTTTDSPVTKAPATTAAPRTTSRKSSSTAATRSGASPTTMPTLPPSTPAPELLTDGPENPMAGPAEGKAAGVSTSAALRWVIVLLVLVGVAIAGLTVAYWRHTRPRPAGAGVDDDGPGGPPPGGPTAGYTPVVRGGASGGGGYPVTGPSSGRGWEPTANWNPTGGPSARPWDDPPSVGAGDGYDRWRT